MHLKLDCEVQKQNKNVLVEHFRMLSIPNETPQELQQKKMRKQKAEPAHQSIDDKNTENNAAKVDVPAIPPQPQNKRCVDKNRV